MKIMLLMPCLMLETNRKANLKAQKYALERYKGIDKFVIYDQCYEESDYLDGYEYIGHAKEKMGFITPRNELLKYFYNSDYDYAIWMDGNKTVSETSLNDFNTLIDAVKSGIIDLDVILNTIGINISSERMEIKKRKDYFDYVYLLEKVHSYEYMHGMIMKNFGKYYDEKVYISDKCDVWKGTSEDVYFINLLRKLFVTYLAPTVVVNTPSSSTSTWMTTMGSYDYPPIDYPEIKKMVEEDSKKYKVRRLEVDKLFYRIKRLDDGDKKFLKPYKPRKQNNGGKND